jgi:small subunit ribosomal protein S2e
LFALLFCSAQGKIRSLEQIYLFSLPIKEYQGTRSAALACLLLINPFHIAALTLRSFFHCCLVVDYFLGPALKDEVMKIMPVQKQTRAGQRTRFKAFVVVGDHNGHVGLGVKCAKEVATAIRGAIISAKLNVVPVRRGYWGNKLGKPHTVPTKITGKGGSVALRLIPAPKGAGIVAASTPKKVLQLAGIVDVYTASTGHTKTMGNFIKATFDALSRTYSYLTPDLWRETRYTKPPAQEFTDM